MVKSKSNRMLELLRDSLRSLDQEYSVRRWKSEQNLSSFSPYGRSYSEISYDAPNQGQDIEKSSISNQDCCSDGVIVTKWLARRPLQPRAKKDSHSSRVPGKMARKNGSRFSDSNIKTSFKSRENSGDESSVFSDRRQSMKETLQMMGPAKVAQRRSSLRRDSTNDELKVLQHNVGKRGSLTSRLVVKSTRKRSIASLKTYSSVPADLDSIHEVPVGDTEDKKTEETEALSVISGSSGAATTLTSTSRRHSLFSSGPGDPKLLSVVKKTTLKEKMRRRRVSLRSSSESESVTSGARSRHRAHVIVLLGKFQRVCRIFILLYRSWKFHSNNCKDILKSFDCIDIMIDTNDEEQELLFDISDYKAHKEARLSADTKRILQKSPETRTEEELHHLRIALRSYRSIVEYPVHMQKKIAERAWYEGFEMKRIITREGQWPYHFFFLLSGSVIVSTFDEESNMNRTVCLLNRGDSFGELSIINRSRRQTTVISKGRIELLVLDDTAFLEIFMSGGLGNPRDPFLLSVFCLEQWPLEILGANPKKAMFSFFKRGTVLTKDSTTSEWIYIVKSGSCRVLKKLNKEVPAAAQSSIVKNSKYWRDAEDNTPTQTHEEQVCEAQRKEDDRLQALSVWQRQLYQAEINVPTDSTYVIQNKKDQLEPQAVMLDLLSGRESSGRTGSLRKNTVLSGPFYTSSNHTSQPPSARQLGSVKEETQSDTVTETGVMQQDSGASEADEDQFVSIQTLTKGSVFGLADLVYGHQPSLSLVSNGAEIIMLNKKFYLDHANQHLLTILREKIYPFPCNADMQENLKRTVNWEFNRSRAIKKTMHRLRLAHCSVDDARSTLWTT